MAKGTLKTHFAINAVGALVPLAVSLVTVPIYLRYIGAARYGVLSIVWLLLGYFGFLDLGLSKAAANALARLRAASQPDRARVLVTALSVNFTLGLIGSLVIFLGGSAVLDHVLRVPPDIRQEAHDAFGWIVALFPLALLTGVGIGALESRERFGLANLLQVTGGSVGQVLPAILVIVLHPSLGIVIPASVVARGLTVVAILAVVTRLEGPLRLSHFDRGTIPGLLRYGGWVTVSSVISPVLNSIDQFIIGSIAGVAAVAHYAVPMTMVIRSQVFPAALSRSLFPRMSSLDPQAAQALASRGFDVVAFGYAVVCVPAMIAAPLFFQLWLGRDFAAIAAPIAVTLFVGTWFNAVAFVPYGLMEAQGRPEVPGIYHAVEVVPFVALLWFLAHRYGIAGAAVAWSLRCTIDAVLLAIAARIRPRDLARAAVPVAMLLAAAALGLALQGRVLPTLAAATLAGAAAAGLALAMVDDLARLARQVRDRLFAARRQR
jgi:O-antigen/teichoic acid export membrane protein